MRLFAHLQKRRSLIMTTSSPSPAFREARPRHVGAFQMKWRPASAPSPLTSNDLQLLPKLLDSPLLADVRPEIARIVEKNDRGDFEQETLGLSSAACWLTPL